MAIVARISGKQYVVNPGDKVTVNRLTASVGDTVDFSDLVTNKAVKATVVAHVLAPKVMTRRFRNKSRYQRTVGHRQPLTVVAFEGKAKE